MTGTWGTSIIVKTHKNAVRAVGNDSYRKCRLTVLREAVLHNLQTIRRITSKRLIAVIKEDGYGIGLGNMYRILRTGGVDFFAVGTPWEALSLRRMGFSGNILLLSPEYSPEVCRNLMEQRIIFMVGNSRQAETLRQASLGMRIRPRIHLKIDSGLGRYGFTRENLLTVKFCTLDMEIEGVYTHFASCGKNFRKNVQLQKKRFDMALQELSESRIPLCFTHAAASRTLAEMGDLGYDGVRVGSLLLGRETGGRADFQDAVWLETEICEKKWYPAGELVGYGRNVRLKRDSLIGVVPAGCRDGLGISRNPQGTLPLLRSAARSMIARKIPYGKTRDGRPVPILDSRGMGHTLVDLTDTGLNIGDTIQFPVNPLLVHPDTERNII